MQLKTSIFVSLVFLVLCLSVDSFAQQEQSSDDQTSKPLVTAKSATQPAEADDTTLAKGYAKNVLPLYIDCAKAFSQMAIAALSLTIVFREKVLGGTGPLKAGGLLIASWSCFLVSIGAGLCYQWLAIRLISLKNGYETPYFPLTHAAAWPGNVFGLMLVAFFGGAGFLVVTSAVQLRAQHQDTKNPIVPDDIS